MQSVTQQMSNLGVTMGKVQQEPGPAAADQLCLPSGSPGAATGPAAIRSGRAEGHVGGHKCDQQASQG